MGPSYLCRQLLAVSNISREISICMYSFRVFAARRFAARRDRTGAKDHPPHIQPPSPRTMVDGGALGPGRLWGTCPAPDPGGIGTHAAGMSDRESRQQTGPLGPRQALCRIAERQRECPQAGRLLANLPAVRHGVKPLPPEKSLQTGIRAFRPTSSPLPGRTRQRGRGASPRLPRWPRSACPDAAGRGAKV